MGVAGRVAITRLRDADYPELAQAVARIPAVFAKGGHRAASYYVRNYVRTLVDAIVLQAPVTGDLVRSLHRIHAMLSPGQAEAMMRTDGAGDLARMEFLEVVERHAYAPSVRAAFARGAETPAGIMPSSYVPKG